MRNTTAVIPARGGSLRLPGKNVMLLAGKPLIAYTIEAALECPELSRVIVSTDDEEIARVARHSGAEVFLRPSDLAQSDSAIDDTYRHVIDELARAGSPPDIVIGMQANMPVRKKGELSVLLEIAIETPWATAVATARRVSQRPEWMKRLKSAGSFEIAPLSEPNTGYRKQDLSDLFLLDGAAIAMVPEVLAKSAGDRRVHSYLGDRVLIHVHDERYAVEIDEPDDVALAEFYLRVGPRVTDASLA